MIECEEKRDVGRRYKKKRERVNVKKWNMEPIVVYRICALMLSEQSFLSLPRKIVGGRANY